MNPAPTPADDFGDTSHRRRTRLKLMEWFTVLHLSLFLVAATWSFAGQAYWVRTPLTAFGSLGTFITLAALLQHRRRRERLGGIWGWLVPVILVNLLVVAASFNPSFEMVRISGETVWASSGGYPGRPSSAQPLAARTALWEFDAIWFSTFNVVLVLRRRRALRALLTVAGVNAIVLAIFGTVQKLSGATGLFLGAIPSPQPHFFSSFVYHNHWGAYVILMLGGSIGLAWHYLRRRGFRDLLHSPAPAIGVAVLLLAATLPLSTSRSCTILAMLFLTGAAIHGAAHVVRKRRYYNESIALPVAGLAAACLVGAAAIGYLGRQAISARVAVTLRQVDEARIGARPDARLQLYRDTLRMAREKPWFGWGMASYPTVFTLYNSRHSVDALPVYYHDAHSDWLQAFSEHGIVGTTFFAACALLPVLTLNRRAWNNLTSVYLLAGCALIVLYAWLEFPFGNYAVVLTWWFCFFGALQYSRLTQLRGDRPNSDLPAIP